MSLTRELEENWYYQYDQKVIGPFSKQEIQQNIKRGVVEYETLVMTDRNGVWVKAKSVDGLFPDYEVHLSSESTSQIADHILHNLRNRGFRNSDETDDDSGSFLGKFISIDINLNFSRLIEIPQRIFELMIEKLFFIKGLFNLWTIIPLLLFVVLGIWLNFVAVDRYRRDIAYDTYSKVWEDLKHLRGLKLDERQWSDFKLEVRPKISKINASIEKVADSNDPYTMELLRAGRDYLPQMLDDARSNPSGSEKKFSLHMKKAKQLADRGFYTPLSATVINFLGTAFIILDICLVGFGLIVLFRRYGPY